MKIYRANQIFTPTTTAKINYIERKKLNKRINRALNTQGTQLIIYGHTGCGKTTLLDNKLLKKYNNRVTTNCMKGMTYEQVLLNAFDSLDSYYTDTKKNNSKLSTSAAFKIFLSIKASKNVESGQSKTRLLPPQLTAQNLAKIMGETSCCWVLEDFHKLDEVDKKKLTQCMKVFMDLSSIYSELKIIFIGAAESAREVVKLDVEMKTRVSQIEVPLMDKNEIFTIIRNGFELLNVGINDLSIPETIYDYSSGLPSICHKICLLLCESLDINSTILEKTINDLDEIEIDNDVIDVSPSIKIDYNKNNRNDEIDTIENIIIQEQKSNKVIKIEDTEINLVPNKILLKEFSENNNTEFEVLESSCDIYINHDNVTYAKNEYIGDQRDSIICAFEKAFKVESASIIIEALSDCSRHGDTIEMIMDNVKDLDRSISRVTTIDILEKLAKEDYGKLVLHSIDSEYYQFSEPFLRVFAKLIFADGKLNVKKSSHNDIMMVFDKAFLLLKDETFI